MVDILHYDKPLHWAGTGARANGYVYCYDPNVRQAKQPSTKPRGRPRTTYNYTVKIVHDPLDKGGFKPGTEFSVLERDCMLLCGGFTVGTALIVDGKLCYIHSSGNGNGRQCVKKFKPASA